MSRIASRFAELRESGRAAFVAYVSGGDPDFDTSLALLHRLAEAGADIVEVGVPFTDPMADGPAIQAAGQRALAAGMSLARVLELVRAFRARNDALPIVLMGYFNPIYRYGAERFANDAKAAGVDGLITVDLPPEEEEELRRPAEVAGLDIVRLIAPTTDEARLPLVLRRASGFVYYVSIAGITGTRSPTMADVEQAVGRLRRFTDLPVAVGFGINDAEQAAAIARLADGAVVGSAIVREIGREGADMPDRVAALARAFAAGVHGART